MIPEQPRSTVVTALILLLAVSQVVDAGPAREPKVSAPTAGISRLTLEARISPAFDDADFGNAGPYELLVYRASGVLNPTNPANRMVVGLTQARRDRLGLVEYAFDVAVLRPIDMSKANGKIVYDVINRGHGAIDLSGKSDGGVAFYLKQGYVFVESAWQGELKIRDRGLEATFPVASDGGRPIVRTIYEETTPALVHAASGAPTDGPLNIDLTYPLASGSTASAAVYVHENEADRWRKLSARHLRILDRTHARILQAQGFDAGALYDLVYPATDPVVSGIGFASVRDLISFLRYQVRDGNDQPNPLLDANGALTIREAYAMGVSQSGRFLRVFVWQGFNQDSAGRRVFDAVMPILAGARKGDFNRLFAMPGTVSTQHEWHRAWGNNFPFAYPVTHDSLTGRTDGILARCSKTASCPKIVHLDSDNEMGSAFSWMLTTDPNGRTIQQPPDVRLYLAAGLQHMPGTSMGGCRGNPVPYSWVPFQHALFAAMDQWASDGIAPPPSRYPTLANGGLVSLETAKKEWPAIPAYPYSAVRNVPGHWDYSKLPPALLGTYSVLTPRLNRDGNPEFGILHPQVAVPVATVAGHSLRVRGNAPGDQCLLQGEIIPFTPTRNARERDHDPRPSLEERYPGGQAEYAVRLRAAALRLVSDRLLLPEDVPSVTAAVLPGTSPETH